VSNLGEEAVGPFVPWGRRRCKRRGRPAFCVGWSSSGSWRSSNCWSS